MGIGTTVQAGSSLMTQSEEPGLAALLGSESTLAACEAVVLIEVSHDVACDGVFLDFAADTGQQDGSVSSSEVLVCPF